jgi:hypothetical protein
MADDVQLPDLEVISRYSLAVRAATAPRDEVVAALRSDLEWLTSQAPPAAPAAPARRAAVRRAPRKRAAPAAE